MAKYTEVVIEIRTSMKYIEEHLAELSTSQKEQNGFLRENSLDIARLTEAEDRQDARMDSQNDRQDKFDGRQWRLYGIIISIVGGGVGLNYFLGG